MYERFVDDVFDELAEEYDAAYDEDLLADVGFEGDGFEEFLDEVIDEGIDMRRPRFPAPPVRRCPPPTRLTVSNYPRYQNRIGSLPGGEQQKLALLASQIVESFQSGCRPLSQVVLTGHADRDVRRGREFENQISRDRARDVQNTLIRLINDPAIANRIDFQIRGAGSTNLIHRNPRSERERMENRRVEVNAFLGRRAAETSVPRPPRFDPECVQRCEDERRRRIERGIDSRISFGLCKQGCMRN